MRVLPIGIVSPVKLARGPQPIVERGPTFGMVPPTIDPDAFRLMEEAAMARERVVSVPTPIDPVQALIIEYNAILLGKQGEALDARIRALPPDEQPTSETVPVEVRVDGDGKLWAADAPEAQAYPAALISFDLWGIPRGIEAHRGLSEKALAILEASINAAQ